MNKAALPTSPQVVGTVHSPAALRQALRLKPGAVDWLELRVDHFAADLAPLRAALPRLQFPCIVTVRHPQEGGSGNLSAKDRAKLYSEFLPHASLVDIELRSVERLAETISEINAAQVPLVLSHHFFKSTPASGLLLEKLQTARRAGADLFKVAARTELPEDVGRLLGLFRAARRFPLSVMGMGPLGKSSRLLFARSGSLLNYGYLGEPQVSGQWPAIVLKERLQEVLSEA